MVRSDHVSDETGVNWARTCMPDMRIRMRLSFAINGNDSPNGSQLLINPRALFLCRHHLRAFDNNDSLHSRRLMQRAHIPVDSGDIKNTAECLARL